VADLILVYTLGLPALGSLTAILAIMVSRGHATEQMAPEAKRRFRGQFMVLGQSASIPMLFGVAMYMLLIGRIAAKPLPQLEWAALAYGVPGMMAGFGMAIIYLPGLKHMVLDTRIFILIVVVSALPLTAANFGFAAAFLIRGASPSDPSSLAALIEASRLASLFMAGTSLVVPAMAYAIVMTWRFESRERWKKAIVVGASIYAVLLVGFGLSFLALQAG